jgi:hypothetical protein
MNKSTTNRGLERTGTVIPPRILEKIGSGALYETWADEGRLKQGQGVTPPASFQYSAPPILSRTAVGENRFLPPPFASLHYGGSLPFSPTACALVWASKRILNIGNGRIVGTLKQKVGAAGGGA